MTDEERVVKHLELIQGVINRMAGNSFTIKGWGTALVSVILAFLAKDGKPQFAWLTIIPIVVFWLLDTYYLSLEKAYRALYNQVRIQQKTDFSMKPPPGWNFLLALISPAIWPIYLMLGLLTAIVHCYA